MNKQSLDFYSSVYGIQLSKDPVDVPRQEQVEFDDDYFTSIEKAKYEYPKPVPQPGGRQALPFKYQQGGLLGRGSFGCVRNPSSQHDRFCFSSVSPELSFKHFSGSWSGSDRFC
jgi:hypothetical protein